MNVTTEQQEVLNLFSKYGINLECDADDKTFYHMDDDTFNTVELEFGVNGLNLDAVFCTLDMKGDQWSLSASMEGWVEWAEENVKNFSENKVPF